jgi:hypothetical protein
MDIFIPENEATRLSRTVEQELYSNAAPYYGDLILRELDYIVIISFGYISYSVCFNLYCGGFKLFCNVRVCLCVCVCGVGF